MEFWGVEVKAGENARVDPEEGLVIHLSQASLGEGKKGDSVVIYVNIGDQKLVIGTLSSEKCPQITYDLVFEKEFTLSHNWKNGSVHFCGYKTVLPEDDDDEEGLGFDSDSEEEGLPVANGKAPEPAKTSENKANAIKSAAAAAKQAVKIAEPKKEVKKEDDDSEDSSDDDLDSEDSDDSDQDSEDDVSDGEEVSSDEEDEETPTPKKESKKKRPAADSATKTPVPEKKAKIVTPQKSGGDGKKGGGHTATPHPSKKPRRDAAAAAAASASNEKSKQTPKSGQAITCKSCSKTFNSDGALQSHTKAKHSGGK